VPDGSRLGILEGSTFCICDEHGDIDFETGGLFAEDTRFLSLLRLTINGQRPLVLSSDRVEYFSAAFYMRNPLAEGLLQDQLSIARTRFVGEGMQDHITVENQTLEDVSFELVLEFGTDFADIFEVKEHDFALGDPLRAKPLPPLVPVNYDSDNGQLLLEDAGNGIMARTQIVLSPPGEANGSTVKYQIELAPRERWNLRVDVATSIDGEVAMPKHVERRFGDERDRVMDSLSAWRLRVPQLHAGWYDLEHAFQRSVSDLAALRMREGAAGGRLPAAGMPWFMTVFGRDTIITCLQTLLFGPELARSALEALAELQAKEDNPEIDAEPGKIVHEVRHGKAAQNWFECYYGTVDATPLYLILLSEVWRWTDDAAFVRSLREPAMNALRWIDEFGDLDGDGLVEYARRSERGVENQSWKDSYDSQRFSDGRFAEAPIAAVEVQGYVYDAKRRMAELARNVWRDRELAERLDRDADELYRRINELFWTEQRGGFYVLALDREKQHVDSACSNMGHLLWSGLVPPERVDAVVDALMGPGLWSGWGVRTMAATEAAYNPLSYHNGTVWPHDNSLIAWGLSAYGRWPETQRIVRRVLDAAAYFNYELPEVFAGFPRADTPFPIAYPTAARPQAWAAGTPVLLLQILLGLRPDRDKQILVTNAPELPSWARRLRLTGFRAFDRTWDIRLEEGCVGIEEIR
jgi:glycogen debranching enzyme